MFANICCTSCIYLKCPPPKFFTLLNAEVHLCHAAGYEGLNKPSLREKCSFPLGDVKFSQRCSEGLESFVRGRCFCRLEISYLHLGKSFYF